MWPKLDLSTGPGKPVSRPALRDRCPSRETEPTDVVVDVGANKGSYLPWLSRAVHAGKVVAFEPQPQLAEYLNKMCAACSLENVTINAAAVSEANGEMPLFIPGPDDSPGASLEKAIDRREKCRTIQVPVFSLDRVL